MITFQNSNSFTIDNLWQKDKTVSTLLIPAHLEVALKQKTLSHGNKMSIYLRNLLRMYKMVTHSGLLPKPRKIKTEYQEEGLNLKRVNFRVFNADWIELGELALAFGKSRCWLFTFLLELDLNGFWEVLQESGINDAVPTLQNSLFQVSWFLERTFEDFTRHYHVQI